MHGGYAAAPCPRMAAGTSKLYMFRCANALLRRTPLHIPRHSAGRKALAPV